jgi:protein required for attachment to host cells
MDLYRLPTATDPDFARRAETVCGPMQPVSIMIPQQSTNGGSAMSVTWILVANASAASLYINEGPKKGLRKLREFAHARSRAKLAELITDHSAHGRSGASRRAAYQPATDPRATEAERFASELKDALETGRQQQHYQRLIVCAAPQFMGRLRHHFGVPLQRMLTDCFEKDYTKADPRSLTRKLEGCIYL